MSGPAWERSVSRRPGGQPLVQLSLFESAGFTWGTILSTLVSFALCKTVDLVFNGRAIPWPKALDSPGKHG